MRSTARPVERPESEVGDATGLVGAVALAGSLLLAATLDVSAGNAAPLLLVGTAMPMMVWALLVEKVHRRRTTGLDFSQRHALPDVLDITRTKLVGLTATFGLIACAYFSIRTYADPAYNVYLIFAMILAPITWLLSPLYIGLTTRHMVEPRDGLWHFGKLVSLELAAVDFDKVKDHLLAWTVKAFFLAFMVSILPGGIAAVLEFDPARALEDPAEGILFLVRLAFLFDVCFGTIGYILTFRVLDSHIRSANPFLSGWVAALACYPPFALMLANGPLNYRSGTQEWHIWLEGEPVLLVLWGGMILILAVIYAWATVVFGMRFSNLTHRGIITTGPYRYFRHPAYLSKNLMWWMAHLPFLSTVGGADAVRNCTLLLAVNAIYFARAKTEEKHLLADARYQAYSQWIAEHGVLARLFQKLRRRPLLTPEGQRPHTLEQPIESVPFVQRSPVE